MEMIRQPIPGDSPAGANLQDDSSRTSLYYQARDARSEAVQAEDSAWEAGDDPDAREGVESHWRSVAKVALEALTEQSKDLQLAVWFAEANLRLDKMVGLGEALDVIAHMLQTWWDELHPRMEDGDVSGRQSILNQLAGDRLLAQLRMIPIVEGESSLTLMAWDKARDLGRLPEEKREARMRAGVLPLEDLERQLMVVDAGLKAEAHAQVNKALEGLEGIINAVREKAGDDYLPSLSPLREALRDIASKTEGDGSVAPADDAGGADSAAAVVAAGGVPVAAAGRPVVAGAIQTRAQAYAMIREVARFFRETEPLSPIPYALEQVVRWGNTPLPKLLQELIPDDSAREAMFKMVGIKAEEESSE